MEKRNEMKQIFPRSLLASFLEEWEKKNVDIKFREGDEAGIEWRIWKYKESLSRALIKASFQFKFKRFLLLFEKEGRVCYYDGFLNRVVINLYYDPENAKFNGALRVACRLSQRLSPGIQEFQGLQKLKNKGDIPK